MTCDTVSIDTEHIKLDSLVKLTGIAETGGQAKILIRNGKVFVNGDMCLIRGKKIRDGDKIKCGDAQFEVKFENQSTDNNRLP